MNSTERTIFNEKIAEKVKFVEPINNTLVHCSQEKLTLTTKKKEEE